MVRQHGPNGPPQITWTNIIMTFAVMASVAAGGWALFQTQFASQERQFAVENENLSNEIKEVRGRLEVLRNETIGRHEQGEFEKRLDDEIVVIKEQLRVIEATRPTTGELQSNASATRDQISEIKERVRSLEDNLRRPQALAPVTPAH